jgi:hypothetical protein
MDNRLYRKYSPVGSCGRKIRNATKAEAHIRTMLSIDLLITALPSGRNCQSTITR